MEMEEDILFLASAQNAWNKVGRNADSASDAVMLVGMIMEDFKFGYGGCNGWFENWSELERSIDEWLMASGNLIKQEKLNQLEKENKLLASALIEADKALGYVEYMSPVGESDFYRRASDKKCKKTRKKIKEAVDLAREIVNKEQEQWHT